MRKFAALYVPLRSKFRNATPLSVEEWPLRHVKISTGPQPNNPLGCTFRTTVVDTGTSDDDAPTLLLLHDVPGSHQDLGPLMASFQRYGARVIVANLPGNRFCRGETPHDEITYSYSSSDLAEFGDAVLAELNVKRLSGLVACGMSCIPALHLINSVSHMYSSVCFLAPPVLPLRCPLPPIFSSLFRALWTSSSPTRALCRLLLRSSSINQRLTNPVATSDEAAYAILTLQSAGSDQEVAELLDMTSDLSPLSLLLVRAALTESSGLDALFEFRATPEARALESSFADERWTGWARLNATCRAGQLTRESFFTDKIADIFLRGFAGDVRTRRLQDPTGKVVAE